MPRGKRKAAKREEPLDSYIKYIASLAVGLGATEIVIDYSGGGDSGQVDYAGLYCRNDPIQIPDGVTAKLWEEVCSFEDGSWVKKSSLKDVPFEEALTEFGYYILEQTVETDNDWVNNDGGQGRIVVELDGLNVRVEHETNVTKVEESTYEL